MGTNEKIIQGMMKLQNKTEGANGMLFIRLILAAMVSACAVSGAHAKPESRLFPKPLDRPRGTRRFIHPGITYTQGDFDRAKAMVDAKVEPYYSAFLGLKSCWTVDMRRQTPNRGETIWEGAFNSLIGNDGRRAHDLAVLWKLTGDGQYAWKAVQFIKANSNYKNCSDRGTCALDNGKINLLIEAAEILKDWPHWSQEEQQKFKDMLVYPGYSNTQYPHGSTHTFYWNILYFDPGRVGNQELSAVRGMMAMGIYLDNERIYDRALRYLRALPHRDDDLPYVSGPPITEVTSRGADGVPNGWRVKGRGNEPDWGYDGQLRYYIYKNGQCQESSRDQGHSMYGIHVLGNLGDMAWNQGDDLFGDLDNRILLGHEWTCRYLVSKLWEGKYPDQPTPWEPTGFVDNEDEATFENGKFYRAMQRSGRWRCWWIASHDRGNVSGAGGTREAIVAHYSIRAGLPKEKWLWSQRYLDYQTQGGGYESWGNPPAHWYEWTGWGTILKRRRPWMAGDPGTWTNGARKSGIHYLPGKINAADFDYYSDEVDGNGHTYRKAGKGRRGKYYRDDATVALYPSGKKGEAPSVGDLAKGDWLTYTVASKETRKYKVVVSCYLNGTAQFVVAADKDKNRVLKSGTVTGGGGGFVDHTIGEIELPAGACAVRLMVLRPSKGLKIRDLEFN